MTTNQQPTAPAGNASNAATPASPATEANELTNLVNDLLHQLTVGFEAHNAEMTRLIDRMEERLDRLENNLIAIQNEQNQKPGQSGDGGHST
ncbi:MAG: hypothetical protein M1812_004132 [Candelaria pacifica]|nr:MAG: hypothetical protein M1812_004132 [Candelaria pacifica]